MSELHGAPQEQRSSTREAMDVEVRYGTPTPTHLGAASLSAGGIGITGSPQFPVGTALMIGIRPRGKKEDLVRLLARVVHVNENTMGLQFNNRSAGEQVRILDSAMKLAYSQAFPRKRRWEGEPERHRRSG